MARRILGFVYINANAALTGAAHLYCDALKAKGHTVDLIDLGQPGIYQELDRILTRDEIAFCYAPQGVGSRLGNDSASIWKQRSIPFVSIHGDNPCYNIFNHFGDTTFIANLYLFESFAEINRRYLQTPQIVETMPFQVQDIGRTPIPFHERMIKLLYLKTGESVDECIRMIDSIPQPLRDGIWQQLGRAASSPDFQVCDLVQELFDNYKIARGENFDLFWGCAHWMDMYLRRKRAADMVEWLKMQEGAVIVGNGWDFIDKSNARAEFRSSVHLHDTHGLYNQTQFIVNTTPYGRDIIHERVGMGLMNESIVISDSNAWWREHFRDVPALKLYDWGTSLDDQLQPLLAQPVEETAAMAPAGREKALTHFTNADVADRLLACALKTDPECLS